MLEQPAIKLVILDRDGVINEDSDDYIKTVDEWVPVSGSIEALARLSKAGFLIAVATNQSGIGRGFLTEITLANIHNLMNAMVEEHGGHIAVVCYCPHLPGDNCTCRKPLPGLLEQIESSISASVVGAWYVGDSLKDIQTAQAKNCIPLLVRTGKGTLTEAALPKEYEPVVNVFDNLAQATDFILTQSQLHN